MSIWCNRATTWLSLQKVTDILQDLSDFCRDKNANLSKDIMRISPLNSLGFNVKVYSSFQDKISFFPCLGCRGLHLTFPIIVSLIPPVKKPKSKRLGLFIGLASLSHLIILSSFLLDVYIKNTLVGWTSILPIEMPYSSTHLQRSLWVKGPSLIPAGILSLIVIIVFDFLIMVKCCHLASIISLISHPFS